MRILTIRGENLASLADAFTIDLTAEPLRSAGLFLISGETGAGKSTILDAMCLALYGTCPRLGSRGVDDNLLDLSGDRLKSSDPRSILPQGCTTGWAEVDFEGHDGRQYRARWAVRRARGQNDGRLQAVERSLYDLDQDRLLENGITQVNARVAQLAGLSYEEFRRTVLLPQGDFDAFLQSNTGERAAILEKVTGTEIYRRISSRIYARTEEARARLAQLETRCGEHMILSPEERLAATQDLEDMIGAQAGLSDEILALQAKAQRHRLIADSQARLEESQAAFNTAKTASDAAGEDRKRLDLLERCEPFRADWRALQTLERDRTSAAEEEASSALAETEATRIRQEAEAAEHEALGALEQAEAEIRDFEPLWAEAARLDEQIRIARETLGLEEDGLRKETEAGSAAEHAAKEIADRIEACASQVKQITETLEGRKAVGEIAGAMPSIREQLRRYGAGRDRAEACDLKADTASAEIEHLGTGKAAHQKRKNALLEKLAILRQGAEELAREQAGLRSANPGLRRARIVALLGTTRELRHAAQFAERQLGTLSDLAREADSLSAEREEVGKSFAIADQALQTARKMLESIEEPARRAADAASDSATRLRARLTPGQPCPVCHATEHPVSSDIDLQAVADQLRGALETSRAEVEKHRAACDGHSLDIERIEMRLAANRDSAATAQRDLEGARGSYAAVMEQLRSAIVDHPDVEAVLPAEAELALDAIDALDQALIDQRGSADRQEVRLREIGDSLDACRQESDDIGKEIEELNRKVGAAEVDMARHETDLAHATVEAATAREEMAAAAAAIRPVLEKIGLLPDQIAQPGLEEKLEKIAAWWNARQEELVEARRNLDELAPRSVEAEAAVSQASRRIAEATDRADTCRRKLSGLGAERGKLLDGEDTTAHRSRRIQQASAFRKSCEEAREALGAARLAHGKVAQRLEASRALIARLGRQHEHDSKSLEAAVTAAGLSLAGLHDALQGGTDELRRLRESIAAIDRSLGEARSVRDDRKADLDRVLEEGIPEPDAPTVAAAILTAQARQKDLGEEIGAARGRLQSDDLAKARLSGLQKEIEEARAELQTFEPVNAAVGQANGNRFAQFAQSVTLAVLIERANMHLKTLRPRYRLDHGGDDLSIQVIDEDMAGERRSTNSLSGGERFLVSLALALALSGMGGNGGIAGTLFIDEGFGSLGPRSLDMAMEALERLQSQGRTVGLISHVELMKERIPVKVMVRDRGAGRSSVSVTAA